MPDRVAISVLLLTLNEEANLPRCFEALAWCDDVVVLDSISRDGTREIGAAAGARVLERAFDDFASQRNFALDTVEFRHEWILHLDADEVVTPELIDAITDAAAGSRYDAYRIPSKLMFQGRWLRRAGMYPAYQVRLTRQGAFRFRQVGHGQKEGIDAGRIGTIDVPYLHYAFSRGLHEWFEKHNRYSTDEARDTVAHENSPTVSWRDYRTGDRYRRRQALRSMSRNLPFRSFFRFVYMYILRGGVLEGRAGLTYCLLLAIYEFMIDVKVREMREVRD